MPEPQVCFTLRFILVDVVQRQFSFGTDQNVELSPNLRPRVMSHDLLITDHFPVILFFERISPR